MTPTAHRKVSSSITGSPHVLDTGIPGFGATVLSPGRTQFNLWAPSCEAVGLVIENEPALPMERSEAGFFSLVASAGAGTRYRFQIGDLLAPDPASRSQAGDVHDPSVVVDPNAYIWRTRNWIGRPWAETVLYEVHAGLMGGFTGIKARLPALVAMGVTAIELMPIADFPGKRNWGYDGVLHFAPDAAYGAPEELKDLIDTAHGLGLSVFLDVVYNHFGPDGNYISAYAKSFFRDDVHTPWGQAIDFRQPAVRRFFTGNALYWLREYRFDGLRFDAVHEILEQDWLTEMAAIVRETIEPERHVHLVLENDDNSVSHLESGFDAQWNDDGHHVLHTLLTGETEGYYKEYAVAPTQKLARFLEKGFIYQGVASEHKKGEPRGPRSVHLSPTAFVLFLQNHDQIGNRAFGERLTALSDPKALRAAVALQLLSPKIPLIFMGEEWGSKTPFLYFTDHNADLAGLVRDGRRSEFKGFAAFASQESRNRIPDPNAVSTFEASRLDALERQSGEHAEWLHFYTTLLRLRHLEIIPRLEGSRALEARIVGEKAALGRWRMRDGTVLTIALNLGNEDSVLEKPLKGRCLFTTEGEWNGTVLNSFTCVAVLAENLSET